MKELMVMKITRNQKIALFFGSLILVTAGLVTYSVITSDSPLFLGVQDWKIEINGAVEQEVSVPYEALYNGTYDTITKEFYFINDYGTEYNIEFTGVKLWDILQDAANLTEGADYLYFYSIDEYFTPRMELNLVENNPEDCILAFKEEGKWLKPKNRGGDGPVRAIVGYDLVKPRVNSQYWAKYLFRVVVQDLV